MVDLFYCVWAFASTRHRCQRYYRRVFCFVLYLLIVHIRCSIDIVGSPSSRYCRPPLAADHFAVANDLTDSVGMRQIARFFSSTSLSPPNSPQSPAVRRWRWRKKRADYSDLGGSTPLQFYLPIVPVCVIAFDFHGSVPSLTRRWRFLIQPLTTLLRMTGNTSYAMYNNNLLYAPFC
ncbi:hypothetical protein KZ779_09625 [Escherichia coli]|nr:hypothetical protein [Escherichia coli]